MAKQGKKTNAQVKRKLRRRERRLHEQQVGLVQRRTPTGRQTIANFDGLGLGLGGYLALGLKGLLVWLEKRREENEAREQRCLVHLKCMEDPDFGRACWDLRTERSDRPTPVVDDDVPTVEPLPHMLAATWDEATGTYIYCDPSNPSPEESP